MAISETHFLALVVGGKEIRGKGYFRMEVGPRVLHETEDEVYEENDGFIRFQKPVEPWGLIDRAAIYDERTGKTAMPMYEGVFSPPLSPTAGDRVVIPPGSLKIYPVNGTLTAGGYLSEGEAFTIDRIPFHPTISHRIYVA